MKKVIDQIVQAIYQGDYANLPKLLDEQNVNALDRHGRTALHHAVLDDSADVKMIEFLVKRGADVNLPDSDQEWTPLHFAARDQKREIVKLLLKAGAVIDPVDVFGNTPLWRAVMGGNPPDKQIVKMLLKAGANPKKKNKHRVSPSDLAEKTGMEDLLKLMKS